MFEDVVEILDPEMNIDSETGDEEMQVKIHFFTLISFITL